MTSEINAEGWYEDPYTLHQHRWFSAGHPSSLVRDDGVESKNPPPDRPIDDQLVRATSDSIIAGGGSDLRRVGDRMGDPYDSGKASDAALDASTWFPIA